MPKITNLPSATTPMRLTADTFVNALRILKSIDAFELAHLNWSRERREAFFDDPERFLLTADDATVDALFAIIDQRMPRKVREAAAVVPLVAKSQEEMFPNSTATLAAMKDDVAGYAAWDRRHEAMPPDPTAQTEPLTIGQQIVASYETDAIAEPCDLAAAIDKALRAAREARP